MLEGFKDYIRHERMFSRNARLFMLAAFFLGITPAVFQAFRNLYFEEVGFSRADIGEFTSIQQIGPAFFAIPAALILSRFKPRFTLAIAVILRFVGFVGQVYGHGYGQILAASGVLGIATGFIQLSWPPMFMRSSTPKERVYVFGLHRVVQMTIGVGVMLLAGQFIGLLAEPFGKVLGYRYVLLAGALATLFAVIPYLLIRDSELSNAREIRKFRLSQIRNKKVILKICIPHLLIGAGSGLFVNYLNLYFKDRLHATPEEIGFYYAIGRATTVVGFIFAPLLAKKLGLLRSVVATEFLSLPFLIALGIFYDPFIVIIAFITRQALMNMTHSCAANFAMEVVPPEQQAITNSFRQMSWFISRSVFAFIGGQILHHFHGTGYEFTIIFSAAPVLYLAAVVSYFIFFRRHRLFKAGSAETESAAEAECSNRPEA
ncbi:MAG: MFS transporter [Planctomycetota bacterium]|jgi:predicted MFS family arabinose efflux permease